MIPTLLAVIPQPDPTPLAAPAALLWFLLILTFFLHLLPMNFVLGGSIVALVARIRAARPGGEHSRELVRYFAKGMPIAVAAAVSFGVAPLLFVQALYGRLFFPSSVLMAWFWFAVIPLLMLAYYGTYLLAFQPHRLGGSTGLVAWTTAIFFVVIAFLYTSNMTLMLRPDAWVERYARSAAGLQLNLDDPTLWPRFLHMLFGALAVTGIAVAHYGLWRRRRDADPAFGSWAMKHGALWFCIPTGINILWGMWWLVALPKDVMLRFMGKDMFATATLGLGILLGLASLFLLALAVYAPRPEKLVRIGSVAVLLTLVLMILSRDQVRRGMLEAAGFEANPWVQPQWGPIALFALLLAGAVGAVAWMVLAYARSGPGRAEG
jgi:hypothetical protein